jgi:hypothetical protein
MARVIVTDRDLAVLSFAVDQFAISMPLAATLVERLAAEPLSRSVAERLARRLAARLEAGHYIKRVRVAGQVWLVPTGAGLALATPPNDQGEEDPYRLWHPVSWKMDHVDAVGRLRLHLLDTYPGSRWESERSIRRRWHETGARVRHADGGLHLPDGRAAGLEVELHIKRPELYRGIVGDTDPAWTAGVWWYTPAGHAGLLQARLDGAGAGDQHLVHELPKGVAR